MVPEPITSKKHQQDKHPEPLVSAIELQEAIMKEKTVDEDQTKRRKVALVKLKEKQ